MFKDQLLKRTSTKDFDVANIWTPAEWPKEAGDDSYFLGAP